MRAYHCLAKPAELTAIEIKIDVRSLFATLQKRHVQGGGKSKRGPGLLLVPKQIQNEGDNYLNGFGRRMLRGGHKRNERCYCFIEGGIPVTSLPMPWLHKMYCLMYLHRVQSQPVSL